jgi:hypothetical protein
MRNEKVAHQMFKVLVGKVNKNEMRMFLVIRFLSNKEMKIYMKKKINKKTFRPFSKVWGKIATAGFPGHMLKISIENNQ